MTAYSAVMRFRPLHSGRPFRVHFINEVTPVRKLYIGCQLGPLRVFLTKVCVQYFNIEGIFYVLKVKFGLFWYIVSIQAMILWINLLSHYGGGILR